MPARTPATIFSWRLRRCFFDRGPLGLPATFAGPRPAGGRPEPPERAVGRPGAPERDAVVRARPLPADRPEPPPPVGRERAGVGRRTDPARGATGEVSSCDGTR